MKSRLLALSALAFVCMVLLIISCSEDKSTEPDNTDLQVFMRSQVADDVGAIVSALSYGYSQFFGFDTLSTDDFLGKAVAPANPLDTFTYEYTNGWHICCLSKNSSIEINDLTVDYDASICDSLQFRQSGTIVQLPTPSTDSIAFKVWMEMLLDMQLADTSLTMSIDNFHIDCSYQLEEVDTAHHISDTALVSGDIDFEYTIEAQQGSDHAIGTLDYSINVVNLRVAGSNGCPQSGSIAASFDLAFEGPNSEANGHWTMTASFIDESHMFVQLDGPNMHLSYTGLYECGGGFLAAPVHAFMADH